ncbi:MAG TPA: TRAM domain-containing protein [Candidatus Solibacter sp.]|jgi:23S rRNA (uracil1939-C5)-methyltransferase|nr:TRAM domain-containing protein [Candidatus Solibacter sp.]
MVPPASDAATQSLELVVGEMTYGSAALARTDEGQVVFVDDALPGERVRAEVSSRRRNYLQTRAVDILEAAPGRVPPPCRFVPECGGCQWQHANYEQQLEMKLKVVAETLRRAGASAPAPELVAAADPFRYRIRGEFHVVRPRSGGGRHQLGFNKRRTYDLVPVDDCLIHHPHITEALAGIGLALDDVGSGSLRSIRLTAHPNSRELLWRGLGGSPPKELQDALSARLDNFLVHQDSLSIGYDGALIDGRPGDPLVFRVDSETFVQVNHSQAHKLYGCALSYIGDRPGALVEGYSGFGAISILAATRTDAAARPTRVTMVEEARAAAILARLHVRLHGVEQSSVLAGRLEDKLFQLEPDEVDTLVVDPPRAGCAPPVLAEVARLHPRRMVYVSCDPSTLGRDLARLAAHGYRVEAQTLVDMFPQTYHIETVSLLVPGAQST